MTRQAISPRFAIKTVSNMTSAAYAKNQEARGPEPLRRHHRFRCCWPTRGSILISKIGPGPRASGFFGSLGRLRLKVGQFSYAQKSGEIQAQRSPPVLALPVSGPSEKDTDSRIKRPIRERGPASDRSHCKGC